MASEAASSSSSVSNNSFTYQVFLSFRGEDTRHNFTDTLYNILREKGINTFIDDKLPKGEKILAELVKAINESEVSIIVFSENYAASRWCLDELVEILQCKASNQHQVRPIFYKVDPSHVRHQKGKFGDAFNKLDRGSRYKDSMPKWRKALSDAADLSGWHFSDGESEFEFISKIVKELSINVLIPSNDLEVAKYPIGVDLRRQHVEKLLDMENDSVEMLGIWGPGGVGKSTIAKAVFNSIERNFESSCFLADVRSNSIPHGGLDKLQKTLLSDMRVSYMRMMQQKKVLLVLDDVSDLKQLEKLAPSSYYFGPGSRIIITTRDERVLAVRGVDSIYGVEMLDDVQASELFSWHAFNCDGPPEEYRSLTERAVNYASGLPLALVVLGSHLFRRSIEEWQDTFNSSKGDHQMDIENVLKISYDALGPDLKEMFLDIACFFNGDYVIDVKPIFEACYDLKPVIGLKQLEEKALIRVVDMFGTRDRIWMHDLIEEMGKNIGKSSRLWNEDDVDSALRDNYGTKEITGIQVPSQWSFMPKMSLNAKSFSEMKNLKYMSMGSGNFELSSIVIHYLSNELRWLEWHECPLLSFPTNFFPKKLVHLNITKSFIRRPWERQKMPALKYIELEDCKFVKELPDFTETPNLESLILWQCPSLVKMHHSVGALHKLVTLRVSFCFKLTVFPKFNGNMDSLRELDISRCGIKELDSSIGKLIGLEKLSIHGCGNFTTLPSSVSELKNLEKLSVSSCKYFVRFPVIYQKMDSLRELSISDCGIEELDESIGNLTGLQGLTIDDCSHFTTLPYSIYGLQNIRDLHLYDCSKLTAFPTNTKNSLDDNGGDTLSLPRLKSLLMKRCNLSECDFLETLDCLDTLTTLHLAGNKFLCHLPKCISKFLNLEELDLSGCDRLLEVLELPPNLVKVDASDCVSLERIWNLSEALGGQQIRKICLWNCCKLGFNIVSLEGLLLNIQANSQFSVVFPGTITAEDAKCLVCWKAVTDEDEDEVGDEDEDEDWSIESSITISKNLQWETLGLAVITEIVKGASFDFYKEIFINGVLIHTINYLFDYLLEPDNEGSSCHVGVDYILLTVEMKAKVDGHDQNGYSSLPHYECVVRFGTTIEEPDYRPLKSCGVHLVCKESKDDENSSHEVLEGPFKLTARVNERSCEYGNIRKLFAAGMGHAAGESHVVAMYKGLNCGARFETFQLFSKAVAEKCDGDANVRYAWYGGGREEIAEILAHGFSSRNGDEFGRVKLFPSKLSLDGALDCDVDEDGMRHMLLCTVIMGKMELVLSGSDQSVPSSNEFDSGVDSYENPRRYFVWSAFMNSHICPAYAVSFKAPYSLEGYATNSSDLLKLANPRQKKWRRFIRGAKSVQTEDQTDLCTLMKKMNISDLHA